MRSEILQQENNLTALQSSSPGFEALYLTVRALEKRIYSDEEVRQLPGIAPTHVHYNEWKIRKRSSEKLVSYLAKKNKPLNILEIGCGNGWLAAKLADISGTQVYAMDVNQTELKQAQRVFAHKKNLQFLGGDFDCRHFIGLKFDVVIFAAAIQYFSPVENVLKKVMNCLADDGEIHLADSNFYTPATVQAAKQRTHNYYAGMGYPKMAANYFHHQLSDLDSINCQILFNPNAITNRLLKISPFYWIVINKNNA